MNYLPRLSMLGLFCTLIFGACSTPPLDQEDVAMIAINNGRYQEIADVQDYHNALILGTLDLLNDPFFVTTAIRIAEHTNTLSENSDYYAHYNELAPAFAKEGRNLLDEMKASLKKYSNDQKLLGILNQNGFSFSDHEYDYHPRVFMPSLDELSYNQPTQIARLMFTREDGFTAPIWTKHQTKKAYGLSKIDSRELNKSAIWLVNSAIFNRAKNNEVDGVAFEGGGKKKCKKSSTTNFCNRTGSKCKCYFTPDDEPPKEERPIIEDFIDGKLGDDFYIQN